MPILDILLAFLIISYFVSFSSSKYDIIVQKGQKIKHDILVDRPRPSRPQVSRIILMVLYTLFVTMHDNVHNCFSPLNPGESTNYIATSLMA